MLPQPLTTKEDGYGLDIYWCGPSLYCQECKLDPEPKWDQPRSNFKINVHKEGYWKAYNKMIDHCHQHEDRGHFVHPATTTILCWKRTQIHLIKCIHGEEEYKPDGYI
jgi:hypothetical protein